MRNKSFWSCLLILLYNSSITDCLVCSVTGSTVEDEKTSNHHNTANEKLLSMHIRTSSMPIATTPAPSGSLQMMNVVTSLSNAGSGENILKSDQQHHRSSFNLLSEAMSQAVSNEYSKFIVYFFICSYILSNLYDMYIYCINLLYLA